MGLQHFCITGHFFLEESTCPWWLPLTPYLTIFHNENTHMQCWKFPQVRQSEASNFGGGLGTFCRFFFNFMHMIWDSRHEDPQLVWLIFKHCPYGWDVLEAQLTINHYGLRCPLGANVVTSHHLNQWWPSWLMPYAMALPGLRPHSVNDIQENLLLVRLKCELTGKTFHRIQ